MEEQERMMRLALTQARRAASMGEIPVGAVLCKEGRVLAQACNLRETSHDPTAHAEILCMRQGAETLGDWRLRDCTLYVTLEPCPMCAGAMAVSQLACCVFGAEDARQGCCGSVYDLLEDPALGSRTRWVAGVLREECTALLRQFFSGLR